MLNSNDGANNTIAVIRTANSYFLFVVTATININEIAITTHANIVIYLPPSKNSPTHGSTFTTSFRNLSANSVMSA